MQSYPISDKLDIEIFLEAPSDLTLGEELKQHGVSFESEVEKNYSRNQQ